MLLPWLGNLSCICGKGWVSKVLAAQVWGSEYKLSKPTESQMQQHMAVTLTLLPWGGRWRRESPRKHSSQLVWCTQQQNQSPSLRKDVKWTPILKAALWPSHAHCSMCEHADIHTYTQFFFSFLFFFLLTLYSFSWLLFTTQPAGAWDPIQKLAEGYSHRSWGYDSIVNSICFLFSIHRQ